LALQTQNAVELFFSTFINFLHFPKSDLLTDYNDINPDEIAGQIFGDVEGTFVADMNVANAGVDEADNNHR